MEPDFDVFAAPAVGLSEALERDPLFVGFDPLSLLGLLTALIPWLVSLCQKQPDPVALRQRVQRQYNPHTGQYARPLVRRLSSRAREMSTTPLTLAQAEAIALAALDEVRTGDPVQLELCCQAAPQALEKAIAP